VAELQLMTANDEIYSVMPMPIYDIQFDERDMELDIRE